MEERPGARCRSIISGRRHIISGRSPLIPIIAVVAAFSCSGCIWLAIPSLAYEGYKYEKTGSFTGNSSSSTSSSSSSSQSQSTGSNHDSSSDSSQDHSIE
ncbi:MAG: hypothetical protein ABSG46_02260 [Candidatus Binataceae bacterium]|jgi:hypothetical protein